MGSREVRTRCGSESTRDIAFGATFAALYYFGESRSQPVARTRHFARNAGHQDVHQHQNSKSDNQFAAAVAYYYKFEAPADQRKDAINAEDLVDACRKAQRKRPNKPGQVLVNALHQGLLDKAERGQYRINSVGENLVAMVLPSQDGGPTKRPMKKARKKPAIKVKRSGK